MFTNLEKARAEVSCYTYCIRQVGKCIDRKNYTSASVFHVKRSTIIKRIGQAESECRR